jgi:hypothetical protein
MSDLRLRVLLTVTALLLTATAGAQTPRATIRGVVLDQTGARLPSAHISVTREETSEVRNGTSDEEGRFTFAELAAGRY